VPRYDRCWGPKLVRAGRSLGVCNPGYSFVGMVGMTVGKVAGGAASSSVGHTARNSAGNSAGEHASSVGSLGCRKKAVQDSIIHVNHGPEKEGMSLTSRKGGNPLCLTRS
jgi:hypothetical protein